MHGSQSSRLDLSRSKLPKHIQMATLIVIKSKTVFFRTHLMIVQLSRPLNSDLHTLVLS